MGVRLGSVSVSFLGSSTWGAKRVFWGGKSDHFGCNLEALGVNLGVFLEGLGDMWNTSEEFEIFMGGEGNFCACVNPC